MNNIGRIIYGYCEWFFGRDSYDDKMIIGEWYDWIVVQEQWDNWYKSFTTFKNTQSKQQHIDDWANRKSEQ